MDNSRRLAAAKVISILGFLVLLASTYFLRSEVLTLNTIRSSADETRANYELEQFKKDFEYEKDRYKMAMKHYEEVETKHYEKMLDLYRTDYDKYVRLGEYDRRPPRLPTKPNPPRPPEYTQKLMEINTEFRVQKHHYFAVTSVLNWLALAAALCLVGGLLYLIMFDVANARLFYCLILVLSFIFMIGPSFHSIISAIVGFLEAPRVY